MADFAELCIKCPEQVTKLLKSYAAGGERIDAGELQQVFADLGVTPLITSLQDPRRTIDCAALVETLASDFKRSRKELNVLRSLRSCRLLTDNLEDLKGLFRAEDVTKCAALPCDKFLRCLREFTTIAAEDENSIIGPFLSQVGLVNYRTFLSVVNPCDTPDPLRPGIKSKSVDMLDLLRVLRDFVIRAKQCGVGLLESFELFDTNKDGKLSANEFMDGLKRLGLPLSPSEAEVVLNLFCDQNPSILKERGICYFQFLRFIDNDCTSNGVFKGLNKPQDPFLENLSPGVNGPFVAGVTVTLDSEDDGNAGLLKLRGQQVRLSRTCAGICHQYLNLKTQASASSFRKETYSCVLRPHTGPTKLIERVTIIDPSAKPRVSKLALQRNQVSQLGYLSDLIMAEEMKEEKVSVHKTEPRKAKRTLVLSRYKRLYKQAMSTLSWIEQSRHTRDCDRVSELLSKANKILPCVLQLALELVLGSKGINPLKEVERTVLELVNTSSGQNRVVVLHISIVSFELACIKEDLGENDGAKKLQRLGRSLLERMQCEWQSVEDFPRTSRSNFFLTDPQCSISCTYFSDVKSPEGIAEHLWSCYKRFECNFHFHIGILKNSKTQKDLLRQVRALTSQNSSWYEFLCLLSDGDGEYADHLASLKSSFSSLELLVLDAIYHKAVLHEDSGEGFARQVTLAKEIKKDNTISLFLDCKKLCCRLKAEDQCLKAHAGNGDGEVFLTIEQVLACAALSLNRFNFDFLQITSSLSQFARMSFSRKRDDASSSQARSKKGISKSTRAVGEVLHLIKEVTGGNTFHPLFYAVYLASSACELTLSQVLAEKQRRKVSQLSEEFVYSPEGRLKVKKLVAAMTDKASCQSAKRKAEVAAVEAIKSRFLSKVLMKDAGLAHWRAGESYCLKAVNVAERYWGHQSTMCADAYFQLGQFYRSSRSRAAKSKTIDAYSTSLHILDRKQGPRSVGVSFISQTLADQFTSCKDNKAAALHSEIGAAAAETCFLESKDEKYLDRAVKMYRLALLKFKDCGPSHKSQVLALSEKLIKLHSEAQGGNSIDYVEALIWNAEVEIGGEHSRRAQQNLHQARRALKTLATAPFQHRRILEDKISRLLRSSTADLVKIAYPLGSM